MNSDEFRAPIDEERRLGDRSVPNKTYRRMLDEEPLFPKKQRPFSINRDAFTNVDVDRSLYGIGEIRTWNDSLSRVSKRSWNLSEDIPFATVTRVVLALRINSTKKESDRRVYERRARLGTKQPEEMLEVCACIYTRRGQDRLFLRTV